ncbi:MAG: flap endonuclease-1 [Candidatus Nanoarchaeia archaeon]
MGVALSKIISFKEQDIKSFNGSVLAVDAMNMLYQFVTTIRQQDGTPLKDSHGNITSHLTGLFARCSKLLQHNIKLVFVFDGLMPELKKQERERRETLKAKALEQLNTAEQERDIASMKKFSQRTARISKEMVQESKELLDAMGIPWVQAPSEGEAQAAHMVKKGECDYVASQDFDCLIYGAPRFVRNISLSHRKKKINALTYQQIQPEVATLSSVLEELQLSLKQLQALSIIVGTDFNVGGIKGLGPKKALKLVSEYGDDLEKLFNEIEYDKHFETSWKDVFELINNIAITDKYTIEFKDTNPEKVKELLVDKHDFSIERVENKLKEIDEAKKKSQQTNLGNFFS